MATVSTLQGGRGEEFDAARALALARSCIQQTGHVSLPVYIAGIEEIHRLFTRQAGQNVSFIVSGMDLKLHVLHDLCAGEHGEHYRSVQSMVDHETRQQLVESQDRPSGTLTLISIHRMMEFVCAGLDKINDATIPDEVLSSELVDCYTGTMGRYHPQLMQATLQWALSQVVPSRAALRGIIGLPAGHEGVQWMLDIARSLRNVYDAVQKVYADHRLLNLSQGSL
ncbi:hypothetical protein ACOMHN_001951 [Nucella lapillus]